jgi:hypothetical protein
VADFIVDRTIARSVFVSKKFHFLQSKTRLAQTVGLGTVLPSRTFINKLSNGHETSQCRKRSGEKEKRKRGRKLKSNPQINRYMIRLNGKDRERFLPMNKRFVIMLMATNIQDYKLKYLVGPSSEPDYFTCNQRLITLLEQFYFDDKDRSRIL